MDKQTYSSIKETLLNGASIVEMGKQKDYSQGTEDVLSNFKRIAEASGLQPLQVWLVYFLKHVDAVSTFAKTGRVASEPIEGRFQDLLNYVFLGYALVKDGDEL